MKDVEKQTNPVVWITGASSGIGEACAYEYARRHCPLVLTSSNRERLEKVAQKCEKIGTSAEILPFDLHKVEEINRLVEEAWNKHGRLDIVLCNAGISQRTSVEDTSMEMIHDIMDVNFYAPVAMVKHLLPKMLQQGKGQIAVTTSIAGRFGFPLRCGYSASKHALYGFFETLQAEYGAKGIVTTLVCPGRVQSNISLNALDKGGVRHGTMDPGQAGGLPAHKAAQKIVRAIQKGRREVLVGRKELVMVYIKRFFPGLCARLAARIKPY